MTVASVLGIGAHRVVVKVKRMGGGFGGKESRYVLKVFSLSLSQIKPVCPKKISKRVSLLKDYFTFSNRNLFQHNCRIVKYNHFHFLTPRSVPLTAAVAVAAKATGKPVRTIRN